AGPAPAQLQTPSGPRLVEVRLAAPPRLAWEPYLYGPLFVVDTSAEQALARRTGELAALERHHHALIDNLPVIVWRADATGRCIYVSGAVEQILGYTPDEIYGMQSFAALNVDEIPA